MYGTHITRPGLPSPLRLSVKALGTALKALGTVTPLLRTQVHRALAWKLLLGYLPQQRSEWDSHLRSKRQAYAELREEVTARKPRGGGGGGEDHPLGGDTAEEAAMAAWREDEALKVEILKDVDRTRLGVSCTPELIMNRPRSRRTWTGRCLSTCSSAPSCRTVRTERGSREAAERQPRGSRDVPLPGALHAAALARVLFVYAKLNPGSRHVAWRA